MRPKTTNIFFPTKKNAVRYLDRQPLIRIYTFTYFFGIDFTDTFPEIKRMHHVIFHIAENVTVSLKQI